MDREFIIIDDNRDGRFVLSRALFRHYPTKTLHEYRDFDSAREPLEKLPADGGLTVVLVHRTPAIAGVELVQAVRQVHAKVTIVALGSPAIEAQVRAAGADRFLDYEAWLGLGTLVKNLEIGRANLTGKSFA